jgi:hypothetical protein
MPGLISVGTICVLIIGATTQGKPLTNADIGPQQKLSLTWKDTFERLHIDHSLDDSLRQQFHEMWNLRNMAVHGPKEREISEDEALRFLKIAKTIWTQLHKTKRNKNSE